MHRPDSPSQLVRAPAPNTPARRATTLVRMLDAGLSESTIRTILPTEWTTVAFSTLEQGIAPSRA